MNNELIALLESHGVKPTANRLMVAKALTETIQPLSLSELERRIQTIDKSNVFRALTLFKEHHLVHAIEGSGDGTYCLDHLHIPEAMLPDGFEAHSVNFIIKGVCPHCREK